MSRVKIEQIKAQKDLHKIKQLIADYKFKPYYFLRQLKDVDISKLFGWQLSKIASGKSNFILAAKIKNSYVGFIILEKQDWDSSFFGFKCYKIEHIFANGNYKPKVNIIRHLLKATAGLCREKKVRYLNVKIDTQDNTSIYAFESYGFKLVSTMLHLAYITKQKRKHFKTIGKIRLVRKNDTKTLRVIAKDSMRFDHFHSDFHFSKETSDNVYVSLIENCCKGILADKVFVVEKGKKVVGYVACKIHNDINKILPVRIGYIRHLAVSKRDGFGCGPGLQEAALNWFKDRVDIVESATTIQNLAIIGISVKSNMNIASSYLRFSKWFGE